MSYPQFQAASDYLGAIADEDYVKALPSNSYDYYDTMVNEEQVKKNTQYMAMHLKEFGYEYIVADIEWYSNDAGTKRKEFQYIPFGDDVMDEFGRFQPSPGRFPSSADGSGFTHLLLMYMNLD